MENGQILDGVDDDLGEKFIWQQQHQAHCGHHQGEVEEIAQRRGLEFEWRRGLKLAARRDEVLVRRIVVEKGRSGDED
jgi:hypothetical protein